MTSSNVAEHPATIIRREQPGFTLGLSDEVVDELERIQAAPTIGERIHGHIIRVTNPAYDGRVECACGRVWAGHWFDIRRDARFHMAAIAGEQSSDMR